MQPCCQADAFGAVGAGSSGLGAISMDVKLDIVAQVAVMRTRKAMQRGRRTLQPLAEQSRAPQISPIHLEDSYGNLLLRISTHALQWHHLRNAVLHGAIVFVSIWPKLFLSCRLMAHAPQQSATHSQLTLCCVCAWRPSLPSWLRQSHA